MRSSSRGDLLDPLAESDQASCVLNSKVWEWQETSQDLQADFPYVPTHGVTAALRVQASLLPAGSERLQWVLGDAEALPLPDSSMDSYTIAFGIRNVTRIAGALEEARRVLISLEAPGHALVH